MSMWTFAKQAGAVGLIGIAGYALIKDLSNNFDPPTRRKLFEHYCLTHCAGDAREIHRGNSGGHCENRPKVFATVTNPKFTRDDRMVLCLKHYNELSQLDEQCAADRTAVWQDFPFPRNKRDELRYKDFIFEQ